MPAHRAGRDRPDRWTIWTWVVCHQANSRIIDHCVKALHADPAKFYKNMDRHGNTSAASIPVALNELAESGQLHAGPDLWPASALAAA
ncbi:MAG: 3-oxoacyl-[acyl-carrier-protein] synthase III C-terminal domain-containing protein [Faecalibacterium prausnitzii]